MNDENSREVYRQRYETFRHFDKLRWQMFQLLAAVASTSALVLRVSDGDIQWWFYLLLGVSLGLIALASDRISSGIRANNKVLARTAKLVGDDGIPEMVLFWKSLSHWIWKLVWLAGGLLILKSLFLYWRS